MSKRQFDGKVAVVIGGHIVTGHATAKAFAAQGATVAIARRNEWTNSAAVDDMGPDAPGSKADVSRVDEIERSFDQVEERFSGSDTLYANAGVGEMAPFDGDTESLCDEIIDANLWYSRGWTWTRWHESDD